MDEMQEAERLAEVLDGATATHESTRGLASMAHELSGALAPPHLDAHERAHIHAVMTRLIESGAAPQRPGWQRVPVTRKQGAVLGGVAAASLVAAIGYAVIHERSKARSRLAAIA